MLFNLKKDSCRKRRKYLIRFFLNVFSLKVNSKNCSITFKSCIDVKEVLKPVEIHFFLLCFILDGNSAAFFYSAEFF